MKNNENIANFKKEKGFSAFVYELNWYNTERDIVRHYTTFLNA